MVELTHEECAQNVDLGQIVCPKVDADPTCTLFSALGTRVVSCQDLRVENSVFVVPKDRLFMLPTKGVGHVSIVEHIRKCCVHQILPIIVLLHTVLPRCVVT